LRPLIAAVAVVGVFLAAGIAWAKDPLITDRPDFTESAFVVGRGTVQLEGGASYADSDDETLATVPELLVRWGMTRKLELRLVAPTFVWLDTLDGSRSGFLNMFLGAKIALNDGEGDDFWGRTGAGLIVATSVPTGSSAVSSSAWQPTAILSLAWDLAETVSVGTNLGWARPDDGDKRFNSFYASVAAGIGVMRSSSLFFELIWFDTERFQGPQTLTLQTGLTYLVTPDVQLDIRAARRLTSEGPDVLIGIGASTRL
jgi:hypothetical protein